MELVYLWVKKYKNIKEQGFNFSPRFECEYDKETKKLTIEKKKNYIENFFDEKGKINITAIVGENGSGKSTLLEILTGALSANYKTNSWSFDGIESNFFLIYKYEGIYYSLNESFTPANLRILNMPSFDIIYEYGKLFELCENLIAILINNELATRLTFNESEQLFIGSSQSNINYIQRIISSNFINNRNNTFNQDTDRFFIPTKINITSLYNEKDINEKIISLFSIEDFSIEEINKNIQYLEQNSKIKPRNIFDKIYRHDITLLNTFNIADLDDNKLKKIFSLRSHLIDIEICNDTKSFKDLSYGERQLLANLNFILFYSKEKEYGKIHTSENEDTGEPQEDLEKMITNEILILIDEFELGLHPNWQKKTIKYIIDFLKKIDKNFHLFITSHSPFILSDLPKENVIFLKKDKDGNCNNITKTTNINPFGANIHTLLSDGFFMEDGLMGEFAKGKINDVYNFIVNHKADKIKTKKEAQDIIKIIGEPLIKRELQQLFDKKFELSNLSLDDEINHLERKLKALKEIKNDKN